MDNSTREGKENSTTEKVVVGVVDLVEFVSEGRVNVVVKASQHRYSLLYLLGKVHIGRAITSRPRI